MHLLYSNKEFQLKHRPDTCFHFSSVTDNLRMSVMHNMTKGLLIPLRKFILHCFKVIANLLKNKTKI